jgi:hypothetical protein
MLQRNLFLHSFNLKMEAAGSSEPGLEMAVDAVYSVPYLF